MNIPDSCIPWIALQRSGYKNIQQEFVKHIMKEYHELQPYLPENCNVMLDIGCGVGGIDVMISHYLKSPKMYLLDNSKVSDKIPYGFDRGESYYNSFEATRDLMSANAVKNYELIDIDKGFPALHNIDLVVSILSWGYHYPVKTYLDYVCGAMSKDGTLIIDIRENTDGVDLIKKRFGEIVEISNYNKSHRICARGVTC